VRIVSAVAIILLAGCAAQPVVAPVTIQRVDIPVAIPCKATIPTAPDFSFGKLTVDKNIHEKTKALLSDRLLHIGYETELLAALTSCIE